MKVIKFGGTSVGSSEGIKSILKIIQDLKEEENEFPIVVISAMSGVTNQLTNLAEKAAVGGAYTSELSELENRHFEVVREFVEIKNQNPVFTQIKLLFNQLEDVLVGIYNLQELSLQSRDLVVSYGERLSAFLLSKIAEQTWSETIYVNASSLIQTDNHFGNAKVNFEKTKKNLEEFSHQNLSKLWIVTGFIASNLNGRVTTLGRGGSDYTAAILGSLLNSSEIQIWTDVDGMLTADPRIVKKAFPLPIVSYTEAMELAYFGAKVIYPPTMVPAFRKNIPIIIKNTFNSTFEGTIIQKESGKTNQQIKGISSITEVSVLNISGSAMIGQAGFSGRLFSLLAKEGVNIILITQSSSEHSITFAVNPSEAIKAKELLEKEFELEIQAQKIQPMEIEDGLSVIAIVGENMKRTPGISGKLFHALGRNGINVRAIAQGSSEYNISVIIKRANLAKALNAVHDEFFTSLKKTVNVFNLGTGGIGSTLLKQLREQDEFLQNQNDLQVKVVGLSNSRKMIFNENGLDLNNWSDELDKLGEIADLKLFIEKIKELNLSNSVFIDNTASPKPPEFYEEVFKANVSIVACNKIANSGSFEQYELLKNTARNYNVDFFYETNVGAGLPIVRTLKDLMTSGDRIIKIEAILSGTISYIFNNFKENLSFHDVVKEAQKLGYTEPDPRDDLSGKDFMRKMLILARDAGNKIEESDVDLGQILPESCIKANSVEDFYKCLIENDAYFEKLKQEAEQTGKVLRYIGKLENGKVSIHMERVDENHPFFNLSGSDNIISFTTERYKETPMVVKGPGAGKEVTAAGVFADLVNIGNK